MRPKIIVVDDTDKISKTIQGSIFVFPGENTAYQIASNVNDAINRDYPAIILINAHLVSKDGHRLHQTGVKVLKYLRLVQHFTNKSNMAMNIHCIIFSFFSIEQLLRKNPGDMIALSKGTTFVRLPQDLSLIDYNRLAELKPNGNYTKYLRADLTLPDDRHNWANWWGIKQLWNVHQVVDPVGIENIQFPAKIMDEFKRLRTTIALYLYEAKRSNIRQAVEVKLNTISDILNSIRDKNLKIIYIDDRLEDGWADILCNMFYHQKKQLESSSVITRNNNLIGIGKYDVDFIMSVVNHHPPDVMLLDLRLLPHELSNISDVGELSGAKLLTKIRDAHLGLPIIIMTASNKIWTYNEVMQLGADDYWIKEGIDEGRKASETVDNYISLLTKIDNTTSIEYKLLKSNAEKYVSIKTKDNLWWTNYSRISKSVVLRILLDSNLMIRTLLQQKYLGFGYNNQIRDSFMVNSAIQNQHKIIEYIYNIGEYTPLMRVLMDRKDELAIILTNIRNKVAHYKIADNFYTGDLIIYNYLLLHWLMHDRCNLNSINLNCRSNRKAQIYFEILYLIKANNQYFTGIDINIQNVLIRDLKKNMTEQFVLYIDETINKYHSERKQVAEMIREMINE